MSNNYNSNSLLEYGEHILDVPDAKNNAQDNEKAPKQRAKKDNPPLLKIGVVANMFNVNASVLRFWEDEFEELEPMRTVKGQRLYSPRDVALIKKIKKLLHGEGLTIEGAKKALTKGQLPKGRQDVRPKLGNIPTLSLNKKEEKKKNNELRIVINDSNEKDESSENAVENKVNRPAEILQKALNVQKAQNLQQKEEEIEALKAIEQELLAIKAMLSK